MAVACFDTHILIWGIQEKARAGQEDMLDRTRALLVQIEKERTQVIIPSIVIGEFLLGIDPTEHPRFEEIIRRRFAVFPYDLRAALEFSRIWHKKQDAEAIAELKASGATKNELRADTMIVATALAAGATIIYGHDDRMRKLAEGFIAFQDVATLMIQKTLL